MSATLHKLSSSHTPTKVLDNPLLLILHRDDSVTVWPKDDLSGKQLLRATALVTGIVNAVAGRNIPLSGFTRDTRVRGFGVAPVLACRFSAKDFARSSLGA